MLIVVIDTSILREDPYFKSAEMLTLLRLIGAGKIIIKLPEVCIREFHTQQIVDIQNEFNILTKKIERRRNNAQVNAESEILSKIARKLIELDKEFVISFEKRMKSIFSEYGIRTVNIKNHHGKNVMDDYFEGNPPFVKTKNRNDIPDSFIYQCLIDEVKEVEELSKIFFLSKDNNLKESVKKLNDIIVYDSLDKLLHDELIDNEIIALDLKQKYEAEIMLQIKQNMQFIIMRIKDLLTNDFAWKEIYDSSIPDDNYRGIVNMVYGFHDVELITEEVNYVSKEILKIPFDGKAELSLIFYFFKADYWSSEYSEKSDMSITDHNDHYYEAEHVFEFDMNGIISLHLPTDYEEDEIEEIFDDVDIRIENVEVGDGGGI